jgi:hypothetical protein
MHEGMNGAENNVEKDPTPRRAGMKAMTGLLASLAAASPIAMEASHANAAEGGHPLVEQYSTGAAEVLHEDLSVIQSVIGGFQWMGQTLTIEDIATHIGGHDIVGILAPSTSVLAWAEQTEKEFNAPGADKKAIATNFLAGVDTIEQHLNALPDQGAAIKEGLKVYIHEMEVAGGGTQS